MNKNEYALVRLSSILLEEVYKSDISFEQEKKLTQWIIENLNYTFEIFDEIFELNIEEFADDGYLFQIFFNRYFKAEEFATMTEQGFLKRFERAVGDQIKDVAGTRGLRSYEYYLDEYGFQSGAYMPFSYDYCDY